MSLAPRLSLWLDEVLHLIFSQGTLSEVIGRAGAAPGGVPLGYLLHWASFQLFEVSALSARLPSVLGSLAACAGVFVLARGLGLRRPILAVAVFALYPLQFRYALEARPYAAALAISVWTMALFDRLLKDPESRWRWAGYGLLASAGLYMQPYSLFILAAQWLWAAIYRRSDRRFMLWLSCTLLAAALSFVPWYAHVSGWADSVERLREHGEIGVGSFLLVAKEITGFGYVGTILTLLGVTAASRSLPGGRDIRWLWLLYVVVPVAGALIADAISHYFLAIRQMIFAITPLAIGFAIGIEQLSRKHFRLALVLSISFLGGALSMDANGFYRDREDWQAAAYGLQAEAQQGACILFVPNDFEAYYTFFLPGLSAAKCASERLREYPRVAVAFAPGYDREPGNLGKELAGYGLTQAATVRGGQPVVRVFVRN